MLMNVQRFNFRWYRKRPCPAGDLISTAHTLNFENFQWQMLTEEVRDRSIAVVNCPVILMNEAGEWPNL